MGPATEKPKQEYEKFERGVRARKQVGFTTYWSISAVLGVLKKQNMNIKNLNMK